MNRQEARRRQALLRFEIIAPLLSQPPEPRALRRRLEQLAAVRYAHPLTGMPVSFSVSTLERWYYRARKAADPVKALRKRRRRDAGRQRRMPAALAVALREQYRIHPAWSVKLHHDNLAALVEGDGALGPLPSYATTRRYLKAQGLARKPRRREGEATGRLVAEQHRARFEVRSFETTYVHGLWHADYHVGSRAVLTRSGRWVKPHLLGILDDHSRLACHLQWYLAQTAETFVHGIAQAIQKRALPRALLTDNGAPFVAEEVCCGLERLGILQQTTLPYSPYQNAKQEVFWAQVEGRLLAMLDDVAHLTLDDLNLATQSWVEREYHRTVHSETAATPLARALDDRSVGRPAPSAQALQAAFRMQATRRQRRSDGTVSLLGRRYEVPSRYRHLDELTLRYARWDLASVELVDPHTDASLAVILPLDRQRNADAERRRLEPVDPAHDTPTAPTGEVAPLLRKLLADYAASGLPPAYLPFPGDHDQ
jgi:transposase InsO family protein